MNFKDWTINVNVEGVTFRSENDETDCKHELLQTIKNVVFDASHMPCPGTLFGTSLPYLTDVLLGTVSFDGQKEICFWFEDQK